MGKEIVIIAPHYDDDLIGNFEIMYNNETSIVFTENIDNERKQETYKLYDNFEIARLHYTHDIPYIYYDNKDIYQFYFPDPIYETHPDHRKWGNVGEQMLRRGFDIIFYSINMNVPYIHKVDYPESKKEHLNKIYASQSSLWQFDHRYFLFEGRVKWLM